MIHVWESVFCQHMNKLREILNTIVCLVSKENFPAFIFKRLLCDQVGNDNKYPRFKKYVNTLLTCTCNTNKSNRLLYYESWTARQVT